MPRASGGSAAPGACCGCGAQLTCGPPQRVPRVARRDESGTGWGWAQWGDCSCTGTGGGIPPPPPPPSPSPSPWVPSPPGPPGPFPPPSPSPPAPGTGNSEATEVDAVAAGFGGFAAVVVSVSLLLIAYRKHRRSRDDIGDLAPRSFEKQALLGNYGKAYGNPPMEQSNASYGARCACLLCTLIRDVRKKKA